MQKLGQLNDWERWRENEHHVVPKTSSGRVTLRVNAAHPVALYYWVLKADGSWKGEGEFLALVHGLDEVQFRSPGAIAIAADADCYVETMAGFLHHPPSASESFTQIVERRQVAPEVLEMMHRARANERARNAQLQRLMEDQQRRFDAALSAVNKQEKPREQPSKNDSPKGDSGDAGEAGKQKPASDGGPPAEKAAKGGEGDGSGKQPKS